MSEPHWTTYLSALLTPTVAVLGSFIAYRQWCTAQNKLKLDLFERRIEIYDTARSFLGGAIGASKVKETLVADFLVDISSARWLLSEEIYEYFEKELSEKVQEVIFFDIEIESLPDGEERTQKVIARAELKRWLLKQRDVLDEKFSPFLQMNH